MKFVKTEKQVALQDLLNDHQVTLAYGGSRSGKTTSIIRQMILRGCMKGSRHLVARWRFNHAKTSLMYDTIPKVFKMCFPGLQYNENRSDYFFSWTASDGETSELWIAGTDDAERLENVLGKEYSSIFLNEISQISFEAYVMTGTRLAEMSGLKLRMYLDCNPPPKTHWSYRFFHKGLNPDGSEHGLDTAWIVVNPTDNLENLSPEYIKILESHPLRYRQRFLEGLYLQDVEGALWTDEVIIRAKATDWGDDLITTIIALDPATTDNPGSDECGIIVAGMDEFGRGVVLEDHTKQMSTKKWAQMAVSLYEEHEANYIVAEVNQGGDLVKDVINNIDPNIKVKLVWASKSKKARAEPVAMLYDQGKISHAPGLAKLEEEQTTWLPLESKFSPNRIDAVVWAFFDLFNLGKQQKTTFRIGVI